MRVPENLPLDDLVAYVSGPDFDTVGAINSTVSGKGSVEEQYSASVELVARLDAYSQEVASSLSASLDTVQRSEKRLPHLIELLKSDLRSFGGLQSRAAESLPGIIETSTKSSALAQLSELHEVRKRIEEVQQLLEASRSSQKVPERAQQFATMFSGTPEEAKWKQGGANYYGIINKIIK